MFAGHGATIIDTDVIARELVQPGRPALAEIQASFGDRVIDDDGHLDRKMLRRVVFADDRQRRRLEDILHPRIRDETLRQARSAGGPYQMIVVPLLVESPMRGLMDRILVVDCDEQIQLGRLLERDTENERQAKKIIAAQASREDRLAIADDIIKNNGDLDCTKQQVERLHRKYLSL